MPEVADDFLDGEKVLFFDLSTLSKTCRFDVPAQSNGPGVSPRAVVIRFAVCSG